MSSAHQRYKVLVVDDEVGITSLIENYLTLEGYSVATTTSPNEALKMVESGEFKIVVSDILMPEMNGADLVRKIKEYDGLVQVIMITGYVTMNNIMNAFRYGATNCIFKPFESMDSLKNEIDQAMCKLDTIKTVLKQRAQLK